MLNPEQILRYFLNDLDQILAYSRYNERWCAEESERYGKYLSHDDLAEMERYENRVDLSHSFEVLFPQISRHVLIVYLYGCLEDNLNQFCKSLKLVFKIEKDLKDAKGKGIHRIKDYISIYSPLTFPSKLQEWQELNNIRRIRDKLVHTRGHLDDDNDKSLMNEIESSDKLVIYRHARIKIHIEREYLINFYNTVTMFYELLIKELNTVDV